MSNQIAPDDSRSNRSSQSSSSSSSSSNSKHKEEANQLGMVSEQLVNGLIPKSGAFGPMEINPRINVSDFTMGAFLGHEESQQVPPVPVEETPFIPLGLAIDHVRKVTFKQMENDMKEMHEKYKDLLSQLDNCYADIEKETQSKYKTFMEKWKSQQDNRMGGLRAAYEEEKKNNKELRDWAENNIRKLQTKIRELSTGKHHLLQDINTQLAGAEVQNHSVIMAVEKDFSGQVALLRAEKKQLETDYQFIKGRLDRQVQEVCGLVLDLIVTQIEVGAGQPVTLPVDDSELIQLRGQTTALKQQIAVMEQNTAETSDNQALKSKMKQQKIKYQGRIRAEQQEKNSVRKELDSFQAAVAQSKDGDNPELAAAKAQIEFLSKEINSNRDSVAELQTKNSELGADLTRAQDKAVKAKAKAKAKARALKSAMQNIEPGSSAPPLPLAMPIPLSESPELHQKYLAQESEINRLKAEISSLEQQLSSGPAAAAPQPQSSEIDVDSIQLQLTTLKSHIQTLTEENERLKAVSSGDSELKTRLEETLESLQAARHELSERPTQTELQALQESLNAQNSHHGAAASASSEQIQLLTQQLESQQYELNAKIKSIQNDSFSTLLEKQSEITRLSQETQALETEKTQLITEIQRTEATLAVANREMEHLRIVAVEAEALGQQVATLTAAVSKLQESSSLKEQELKDSIRQRKLLHNQLEDLKGKIRVFCRVRPISSSETEKGSTNVTVLVDDFTLNCETKTGQVKPFMYDAVFGPSSAQEEVFEDTKALIQSAIDGYNVCIFAYGQTGSGKTYTMLGLPGNQGVTPRAINEMFQLLHNKGPNYKYVVKCYMVELYLDTLVDLFLPKEQRGSPPPLSIKKDTKGMVIIPEAHQYEINNPEELLRRFDEGNSIRHTSATKMNDSSSRSHLIFGILIDVTNREINQRTVGKLSLVDLAGSERVSKTEATPERQKEGRAINKSLTALGDVISALSSGETHIPYRNNKLTMVMSDSLGGTAKTLMFVNVSPASYNREETLMSLYYASRVKMITNEPSKNVESKEMSKVKNNNVQLQVENDKMKDALERSGITMEKVLELAESPDKPDYDDAIYDEL